MSIYIQTSNDKDLELDLRHPHVASQVMEAVQHMDTIVYQTCTFVLTADSVERNWK